jgi:hypothetical protein
MGKPFSEPLPLRAGSVGVGGHIEHRGDVLVDTSTLLLGCLPHALVQLVPRPPGHLRHEGMVDARWHPNAMASERVGGVAQASSTSIILSTTVSAISRDAVAAGDGALITSTTRPVRRRTKSSSSAPSRDRA